MSELASYVRSLRGEKSQVDFALKIKLGIRTLIKIENDESQVKFKTIVRIAKFCKLSNVETLDLIRAWMATQLGEFADQFWMDPKSPSQLKEQENSVAGKLAVEINRLPPRMQEELLKAVGRPEVLRSIKHMNEAYERLREPL